MISAREAREIARIKSSEDRILDDLEYYIKLEAERGGTEIKYRVPDDFSDKNVFYLVSLLGTVYGYKTSFCRENNRTLVVMWNFE